MDRLLDPHLVLALERVVSELVRERGPSHEGTKRVRAAKGRRHSLVLPGERPEDPAVIVDMPKLAVEDYPAAPPRPSKDQQRAKRQTFAYAASPQSPRTPLSPMTSPPGLSLIHI